MVEKLLLLPHLVVRIDWARLGSPLAVRFAVAVSSGRAGVTERSPGLAIIDGFFAHIWASAGMVVIAEAVGHLSFFLRVVTSYG